MAAEPARYRQWQARFPEEGRAIMVESDPAN
jgi:hypothetical protein